MKLGLYEHYKGKQYQVIGVARHTESLEEVVVYQSLYGDYSLWVRPAAMFQEDVIIKGVKQPRFRYLGELCTAGAVLN